MFLDLLSKKGISDLLYIRFFKFFSISSKLHSFFSATTSILHIWLCVLIYFVSSELLFILCLLFSSFSIFCKIYALTKELFVLKALFFSLEICLSTVLMALGLSKDSQTEIVRLFNSVEILFFNISSS